MTPHLPSANGNDLTRAELWTDLDTAVRLRLCRPEDVELAATTGVGSEQARKRLNRAVLRVRAYANRGAIPGAFKIGRQWRFRPDDVVAAEDRWHEHGCVVDADGRTPSMGD